MTEAKLAANKVDAPATSHQNGTIPLTLGEWALAEVLGRIGPRTKKAVYAATAAHTAYRWGKKGWIWQQSRSSYLVSVFSTDDIYQPLHAILLGLMPSEKRKALTAQSARHAHSFFDSPVPASIDYGGSSEIRELPAIRLLYDGSQQQVVEIRGHQVKVLVEKSGTDQKAARTEKTYSSYTPDKVVFTCQGADARDAVVEFLQEISDKLNDNERVPHFYVASQWGDWIHNSEVPTRSLESVVLKEGQKERLIADLEKFFAQEDRYLKMGMPYHRGYLFHGPPGTGKTSVPAAVASHLGLDVYFIPLSDLSKDTGLMALLGRVPPRSMVLLEDIDVLHAAVSREESAFGGLTLSGLLNGLDGMSTPHGLVTVLTSNHPEALDPALVRPGRIDMVEEIGLVDDYQLRSLVDTFVGKEFPVPKLNGAQVSPAQVLELVKRDLDDPLAAALAITRLVLEGTSTGASV